MIIKELSTTNYKHAVVELSYDEIRCLSNSLYQICKAEDIDADFDVDLMSAKMLELFSLLKHGYIPDFELKCIQKHLDKYNEEPKREVGFHQDPKNYNVTQRLNEENKESK